MRIRQTVLALALVLGTAVAALAADVTGTWTAEFDTQIGVQKYVFTFKVDGEKLTGTTTGMNGDVPITDGSIKGDAVAFNVVANFNGTDVKIVYKGTVAGDEIKFTRQREGSDRPPAEFVAKRAK